MFRKHALAVITACSLALSGLAQAVPLSQLFAGGTLTANDKLFSNWTLITNVTSTEFDVGTPVAGTVDLTQIDVSPLTNDPLNPGLRYTADLALGTPFGHDGPATVNLEFVFRVSTLSGDPLIKDNTLEIFDFIFDSGPLATIGITETIFANISRQIGEKSVLVEAGDQVGVPDPDHSDSANFAPLQLIDVSTRIFINGPGLNDGAFLEGFDQRFSQVSGTVVPAPGSAVLLMLGLLGLALQRRARRV